MSSLQEVVQTKARAIIAPQQGTWNEDVLAALRISRGLPNGSLPDVLASIPGGMAELLRNPDPYFASFSANFLGETPVSSAAITYSGGANGTRVNSAGLIEAAVCPRIDHDPVTLAVRGLLVEEQRTNLLLNSTIDGTNLATQSVTLPASAHTLTFYGTGTITLSGAFVGSLVGSGAYPTRSTLTFTPAPGSVTFTVAGTVQYAQLEAGAFPTSYISTAGSTVTRTADSVFLTGVDVTQWFSLAGGTFLSEFFIPASGLPIGALSNRLFIASNGTGNESIQGTVTTAQRGGTLVRVGGVDQFTGTTANSVVPGAVNRHAFTYAADDMALCLNGGPLVPDTSGSIPSGINRLQIGSDNGLASWANLPIRRILYWNTRLPNATLQALTA